MPTSAPWPSATAPVPAQDFLAATARAAEAVDRRRHDAAAGRRRRTRRRRLARLRRATAAAWRATTRFTCSTWTFRAARRATANRRTSRPGRSAAVLDTPVGRLGLSVCYDVRFPELYRHLSAAGAQLLVGALGLHQSHRARALGDAAARARDRESLLRYRAGAVGLSSERPRDLRRQHDRRLLGTGPAARAARPRLRRRRS